MMRSLLYLCLLIGVPVGQGAEIEPLDIPMPRGPVAIFNGALVYHDGRDLISTDGTAEGTGILLTDVSPFVPGSRPGAPEGAYAAVRRGKELFWMGTDAKGLAIYRTDGTAAGSAVVPLPDGYSAGPLIPFNNRFYYGTRGIDFLSSFGKRNLWEFDPATNSARLFVEDGAVPAVAGGALYFRQGAPLLRFDGVETRSVLGAPAALRAAQLNGGNRLLTAPDATGERALLGMNELGQVRFLAGWAVGVSFALNGLFYFSTTDGWFETDGVRVRAASFLPRQVEWERASWQGGGLQYFIGREGATATPLRRLWRTDGTRSGTFAIAEPLDTYISVIAADFDGRSVINLSVDKPQHDIWVTDGTPDGTRRLIDNPGERGCNPDTGVGVYAGWVYFNHCGQLWRTDGTAASIEAVHPDRASRFIHYRGDALFAASGQLWKINGRPLANHESPAQDAKVSGIGVISGWACEAGEVTIHIDGGQPIPLGYGFERKDTGAICADANNGYGLVYNWNLLPAGPHRMDVRIDGQVFRTVEFSTAGFGTEFLRDASGAYELAGFPQADDTTRIEWSEANQNFLIAGGGPVAPKTAVEKRGARFALESPRRSGQVSGVGSVHGWACDAHTVSIRIDDGPLRSAVSGLPRTDTAAVCHGASANGFVLPFNFNQLNIGRHRIVLYLDGMSVAVRSFDVGHIGEEFAVGLEGVYRLPGFPAPGAVSEVSWSQALQNFVISGTR